MIKDKDRNVYKLYKQLEPRKYVAKTEENNRSVPVKTYTGIWLPEFHEKIPTRHIMLTLTLTPDYFYDEAWKMQITDRDKIAQELLEEYPEIRHITSCIEHHHKLPETMKNDKDNLYNIIKSQTRADFLLLIAQLPHIEDSISDYTIKEKLIMRYNMYQIMYYYNSVSNRNDKFIRYIVSQQRVSRQELELIRKDPDYDPEIIWSRNEYKFFLYCNKYNKKLVGYPHIHYAIGYGGVLDKERFGEKIRRFVYHKNKYPTPDIKHTETLAANKNGYAINYVLKNAKNKFVRNSIDRYKDADTGYVSIVKVHVNLSHQQLLLDKFSGYIEKDNKESFQPVPMEIIARIKDGEIAKEEINIIPEIDPEENKLLKLVAHILKLMIQKGLYLCGTKLVEKVAKSKMTYKIVYYTREEFLLKITAKSPYNTTSDSRIKRILNLFDISVNRHLDSLELPDSPGYEIKFPSIEIDYRWVEFKDFFFNTLTAEIYKKQNKYYCHLFYLKIALADVKGYMERFREESVWNEVLKNSKIDTRITYAILFQLLRPKEFKSLTPLFYGTSDAGKTSLTKPFFYYYPDKIRNSFGKKLTEYHIADLCNGDTRLLCFGEANPVLDDKEERPTLLMLSESGQIVANKKHGEIKNITSRANLVMLLNPRPTDTYYEDDAVMNRLLPVKMEAIKYVKPTTLRIKKEQGLAILFAGLEWRKFSLANEEYFKIHENLTTDNIKEIEEIKKYYDDQYLDTIEDVDVFSKEEALFESKLWLKQNINVTEKFNSKARENRIILKGVYKKLYDDPTSKDYTGYVGGHQGGDRPDNP